MKRLKQQKGKKQRKQPKQQKRRSKPVESTTGNAQEKAPAWFAATFEVGILALVLGAVAGTFFGFYYLAIQLFAFWLAITVSATLGTGTILLVFRALLPRLRVIFKIKSEARSNAVTENYLTEVRNESLFAGAAIFILSIVLWADNQMSGAILAVCLGTLVLAHFFVTRYRILKGLFGTTAQEATELIKFIIKYNNDRGTPPGSRLSSASAQQGESHGLGQSQTAGIAT